MYTHIGGLYTILRLSRKAKAAADVDYPAYGVTGPTVDSSGDRKLAQSAHMYHYQHQKQQIIAMERYVSNFSYETYVTCTIYFTETGFYFCIFFLKKRYGSPQCFGF